VHQLGRRGLVRDSHPWPRNLNIELVMGDGRRSAVECFYFEAKADWKQRARFARYSERPDPDCV